MKLLVDAYQFQPPAAPASFPGRDQSGREQRLGLPSGQPPLMRSRSYFVCLWRTAAMTLLTLQQMSKLRAR